MQVFKPCGKRAQTCSRFLFALLAALLLVATIPHASAITQADINALKQQQKEISQNKAALQTKISGVQNDKAKAAKKKLLLEEQIEVIRNELKVTNQLIAKYDQQIADKTVELQKAEEEEARYYDMFCQRVRAMEEGGTVSYWAVLFDSSDFSDLIDRINMVSEVMDHDNHVMDALAQAKAAVEEAKTQLEASRAEQKDAKASLEGTQAELKKQQASLDAIIAEIKAKEAEYRDQLDELSEDAHDLSNDIAAAERQYAAQIEAAKQAQQNGTLTGTGGFVWPLPGYTSISSKYGWRTHPVSGRQSFHGGVDVPAPSGTKIHASKAGAIVISGYNSSYGNYVVIAHTDGSKTLYAHMKSRAVGAGDTVSQGNVIGYVGTTGTSTGNHLHFEIWTGSSSGTRTNPMNFF